MSVLAALAERLDPVGRDTFALLGYTPTAAQRRLHELPATSEGGPFDVMYGGAAGGGKTKALLMDALAWADRVPGLRVYLFRRTYPELNDSLLYELEQVGYASALGASYNASEHVLRLPNGSRLVFRYARNVKDTTAYLSAEIHLLIVDERTTFPPEVVERLAMRVRSGRPGVPVVGIRSGTNPGGPGHAAVRTAFVDPWPSGGRLIEPAADEVVERARIALPRLAPKARTAISVALDRMETGAATVEATAAAVRPELPDLPTRLYLPARISDNPHLDAGYLARLDGLDPALRSAYADGSWDAFAGQRFASWHRNVHVVEWDDVADLVANATRRGWGVDYGLSAPFVALAGAVGPDGLLVVYRELKAVELTPTEQARRILDATPQRERIASGGRHTVPPVYIDPSTWSRSPDAPRPPRGAISAQVKRPPPGSIAARYLDAGVPVRKGNNDRRAGAAAVDEGLRVRPDGAPRLLVVGDACPYLTSTLPAAPRSEKDPEDVDPSWPDDHAYDALRYLALGLGVFTDGRPQQRRRQSVAAVRASTAGLDGVGW